MANVLILQVPIFMRVEAARGAAQAASSGAGKDISSGAAGAQRTAGPCREGVASAAPRSHITRSPQMGQARAEAQLQVRKQVSLNFLHQDYDISVLFMIVTVAVWEEVA